MRVPQIPYIAPGGWKKAHDKLGTDAAEEKDGAGAMNREATAHP